MAWTKIKKADGTWELVQDKTAVRYEAQEPSDEEKAQARANIDAVSQSELVATAEEASQAVQDLYNQLYDPNYGTETGMSIRYIARQVVDSDAVALNKGTRKNDLDFTYTDGAWNISPIGNYYGSVDTAITVAGYEITEWIIKGIELADGGCKQTLISGENEFSRNTNDDMSWTDWTLKVGRSGTGNYSEIFNDYENNVASGIYSHAEGHETQATGVSAHAEGLGTVAAGSAQHVQGKYNATSTSLAHIIGNGTSTSARSNAHTVDWDGNAWYAGDIRVGGTSYATGTPVMYRPNLLINGDFRVNQRGSGTYSGINIYTADHWYLWSYSGVFVPSTGVFTGSGSGNSILTQVIEDSSSLLGQTVTISANIGGTIYSNTATIPTTMPTTATNVVPSVSFTNGYIRLRTTDDLARFRFDIGVSSGASITINWVKLEISPFPTPYSPRPYAEELVMCQRYYQVINMPAGFLSLQESGSSTYIYVQLPVNPNVATVSTRTITNKNCYGSSGTGSSTDITFPYSACYYDAGDPSILIRLSGGAQLTVSPTLLYGYGSIAIQTELTNK